MLTTINAVLIGLVCLATIAVMVQWHFGAGRMGRGAWRHYAVGRAFMGLLALMAVITGLATVSTLVGPYVARPWIYGAVYLGLLYAVLRIGTAITRVRRSSDDGEMDR